MRGVANAALILLPALALAACAAGPTPAPIVTTIQEPLPKPGPEPDWRRSFASLDKGAVLVDIHARRLHYWAPNDAEYRSFPIGVARQPEFVKAGPTRIVRKRAAPDWRPTPSMLQRDPDLPRYVGPGPDNPMGEHALYLGWRYYAIHGTNDPGSIGRAATSGCIRLFPEHIAWLFDRVSVGVPVVFTGDLRPPILVDAPSDPTPTAPDA